MVDYWEYRIRMYGLWSPDVYLPLLDTLSLMIKHNWAVDFLVEDKQIPLTNIQNGMDLQQKVHSLIEEYGLKRRFANSVDTDEYAPAYTFAVRNPNDIYNLITNIRTEYHQESGAKNSQKKRHYEVVVVGDRLMSETIGQLIKDQRPELPDFANRERERTSYRPIIKAEPLDIYP